MRRLRSGYRAASEAVLGADLGAPRVTDDAPRLTGVGFRRAKPSVVATKVWEVERVDHVRRYAELRPLDWRKVLARPEVQSTIPPPRNAEEAVALRFKPAVDV